MICDENDLRASKVPVMLFCYLTLDLAYWAFKSHPQLTGTPLQQQIYDRVFSQCKQNLGQIVIKNHTKLHLIFQFQCSCSSNTVAKMSVQFTKQLSHSRPETALILWDNWARLSNDFTPRPWNELNVLIRILAC